jgi:hypothetical protein
MEPRLLVAGRLGGDERGDSSRSTPPLTVSVGAAAIFLAAVLAGLVCFSGVVDRVDPVINVPRTP